MTNKTSNQVCWRQWHERVRLWLEKWRSELPTDARGELLRILSDRPSDETTGFRCKANRTADPPQDCDWPNCGCDEKATKVIESLVEQGWMPVPRSASMPKRERPQESPSKSKVDYIEELASYCGFVPRFALYGLVRSRELEALLEHLANAQDDVLRLHHAYVDLKYPQTARSPVEPTPVTNTTSEAAKVTARRWRVKQGDYAGMLVYAGRNSYGCANDDTRNSGVEYMACSINESGEPFFTISKAHLEEITPENG